MKVISIQEPYGSLILKGHKKIETRSWKTNYRGELYIHTSSKVFNNPIVDNAYKYIDKKELIFGSIICKCKLVDCIEMTEDFIKTIDPKELELGVYEVGRYAWILEDIEVIKPIKTRGKLNIWEYKEG